MADINNLFVERRNQFHKNIYSKIWRSNPFRGLVPMNAFDLSEGRTPTVRTLTHELPTGYPSAMTEVQVSTGAGNPYCNPAATTIKRGEIHRTFKLYQTAFQTDEFCVSDLKRAEQAAQAIANFERALGQYLDVWWSDWYRLQNIAMVGNHASTTDATTLAVTTDSTSVDLSDVAAPTVTLNWAHLNQVYWDLVRNGLADELAVGRDSKGRPVLPLHASPGIIESLWKNTEDTREQVKYFDSKSNLALLGYDGAVNGFLPVIDLFPIRFAALDRTLASAIYPTVNADATVGRKSTPNPDYMSVAAGGTADTEVVTILGRQVYESQYEAVDPSSFSGMTFSQPKNYIGEFQWVNQRTYKGDNDRGNLGYYLADVRCGAKPVFPELGYSIITKIP